MTSPIPLPWSSERTRSTLQSSRNARKCHTARARTAGDGRERKPDTKTESSLPLDGPNWLPLKYAHCALSQWSGDRDLTTKDIDDPLTDDKSPVRSMLRRYEGPDTLVPPTFWVKFKVSWSGALFVCDPGPPMRRCPGVFFVWEPDLKRRWPYVFCLGAGRFLCHTDVRRTGTKKAP